jgi:hypothetical protein
MVFEGSLCFSEFYDMRQASHFGQIKTMITTPVVYGDGRFRGGIPNMRFDTIRVLLAILITLTVTALTPGVARNIYRLHAIQQYKLGTDTVMTCQYCHAKTSGGNNWNGFGQLMLEVYRKNAKGSPEAMLYLTLKAKRDSDDDGFIDALEVVAKTLPGDPESKPQKTVPELETALKKMGGLDAFKPKN